MKKRIFSILLVLVMAMSMLPVTALAVGDYDEDRDGWNFVFQRDTTYVQAADSSGGSWSLSEQDRTADNNRDGVPDLSPAYYTFYLEKVTKADGSDKYLLSNKDFNYHVYRVYVKPNASTKLYLKATNSVNSATFGLTTDPSAAYEFLIYLKGGYTLLCYAGSTTQNQGRAVEFTERGSTRTLEWCNNTWYKCGNAYDLVSLGGFAPPTYTLTYDSNGATDGTVPADGTYASGAEATVSGNTGNLTKTGYTFVGWNTQADGNGTTYVAGNTITITENTTLYAKWQVRTDLSYTVKFYKDSVSEANHVVGADVDYSNATFGTALSALTYSTTIATDKCPDGYNAKGTVSTANSLTTITTGTNVISVVLSKRSDLSYTVNYLEKDTNTVLKAAKTTGNQTFETVITSADEVVSIDGYNFDSADKTSLTIGTDANKNVINLYYTKRADLSYTVNYLEKDTNTVLKTAKTTGNQTFETVITSADEVVSIDGYNFDSADKTSLTIGTDANKNVINLYYTKRADLSYTVNYLDEDTNEAIHDPEVVEDQIFETVITSASRVIDIDGYVYDHADKESLTIGTDEKANVINLYYAKDTIGKIDDDGNDIGDDIPDKYQIVVKYVAGAHGSLSGETFKAYDLRQENSSELLTSVELNFPTAKADNGYQFSSWTYPTGVTVNDSVMSGFVPGTIYTFTANFKGTYHPVVIPDPTVKVKGLNTVDHVTYIIGVGNDEVNPMGTITRAEVATIYFRLMTDEFRNANWSTANRFNDVPDNAWYTMAILTLDKAGIITDSDDGNFRPNDPITRAELAVMAAQFCTVTGKIPATSFKDVPADHWAAKEIALIEYAGWIEGYAGYFRPDDNLTRAEAVTIVNRMLQRGAEAENMLYGMVTFVDNTPNMWYYEAIQEAANAHDYVRTNVVLTGEEFYGEKWTALLEATDWAAMEKAWIEANS